MGNRSDHNKPQDLSKNKQTDTGDKGAKEKDQIVDIDDAPQLVQDAQAMIFNAMKEADKVTKGLRVYQHIQAVLDASRTTRENMTMIEASYVRAMEDINKQYRAVWDSALPNLQRVEKWVRSIIEDFERGERDLMVSEPYAPLISSGEVSALLECLILNPTGKVKDEIDGQTIYYPATKLTINENIQVETIFKGGALTNMAKRIVPFILINHSFTLRNIMTWMGYDYSDIEARRYVRREVNDALDLITDIQIRITGRIERATKKWAKEHETDLAWSKFALCGANYYNNRFSITPSMETHILLNREIMIELGLGARGVFPNELGRRSYDLNPHSVLLGMRLNRDMNMNYGKATRGEENKYKTIKTTANLLAGSDIPTYEYVRAHHHSQYKHYIIDPFERDMNENSNIYSWEYTKGGGTNWKEFRDAEVCITWINHPFEGKKRVKKPSTKTHKKKTSQGKRKPKNMGVPG